MEQYLLTLPCKIAQAESGQLGDDKGRIFCGVATGFQRGIRSGCWLGSWRKSIFFIVNHSVELLSCWITNLFPGFILFAVFWRNRGFYRIFLHWAPFIVPWSRSHCRDRLATEMQLLPLQILHRSGRSTQWLKRSPYNQYVTGSIPPNCQGVHSCRSPYCSCFCDSLIPEGEICLLRSSHWEVRGWFKDISAGRTLRVVGTFFISCFF